jgi:hypothetical protein
MVAAAAAARSRGGDVHGLGYPDAAISKVGGRSARARGREDEQRELRMRSKSDAPIKALS